MGNGESRVKSELVAFDINIPLHGHNPQSFDPRQFLRPCWGENIDIDSFQGLRDAVKLRR